MTDDQIVLTTLRVLANGTNEFPLGELSTAVLKQHKHISQEALKKHVETLEENGYAIIERGPDPTFRATRPTIRLTEAGITEADRLKVRKE